MGEGRDGWERPSQLAPITTFNAADYIVYTVRRKVPVKANSHAKDGGAGLLLHYHQRIALDRPLQLHRVDDDVPSVPNQTRQWLFCRDS